MINGMAFFAAAWFVVVAIAALALGLIWFAMFIDICMTKRDIWIAAGHDRVFCLCILIGLGPVGAILYGLAVRPHLARAEMKKASWLAKQGRPEVEPAQWAA